MVLICVVKDLHNTNFPAETPRSSLGTDLVDLQNGSGGFQQDWRRSSKSLESPCCLGEVTACGWIEKVVACNAWGKWLPAASFG